MLASLTACAGSRTPAPPAPPAPPPAETPAAPFPSPTPRAVPGIAEAPPLAFVNGTVTYRLRIALTPEAIVQVELRDVTSPDAEAPLVAKQVIEKPGQVPIAFSLPYDPTAILPGHSYAVTARIEDRGQLAFVTDTRVPVSLAGAAEPPEIVVVPVH